MVTKRWGVHKVSVFEKNLKLIEDNLESGEAIIASIPATVRDPSQTMNFGASGALVVTGKRFVFRGGGGLLPRTSLEIKLSAATSFESNNSSNLSLLKTVTLKISFSSGNEEYFVRPDELEGFLSAARGALDGVKSSVSSDGDMSSQLERLSSLHEKGLLDDTEFKSAKAKLLGL
jgi:hypothetical protein